MYFSVVIPLFNKENHIERAIKSVIGQSYKKFELLIIDDGSTDSSFDVASLITDDRIKIIKKENGGVSSARNMGIEKAQYEYIGFLDADDDWNCNFLQEIEKMIRTYPNAGAFATSYEIKKGNNRRIPSPSSELFSQNWVGLVNDYFKYSLKAPLLSASSVVIPKKVFDKVGNFPIGIKRGEDLDMWYRIALNYQIAYSNSICAVYNHDSENRACKKEFRLNESSVKDAEWTLINFKGVTKNSFYFEEHMIKNIITKGRYLIREGKRKEARELLKKYKYTKTNKKYLLRVYIESFFI